MMEALSTAMEVGAHLIHKINEMKALPEECRKLADIVSKLQPIFTALDGQLQKKEHRSVMEILLKALTDAHEVVDYITAHPRLAAWRSGKYKVMLENSMKSIDEWIVRIQPLTSGEIFNQLGDIKADVKAFSKELSEKLDDISEKLEDIGAKIDRLAREKPEEAREARDELAARAQQQGKSRSLITYMMNKMKLFSQCCKHK